MGLSDFYIFYPKTVRFSYSHRRGGDYGYEGLV
jgi:hypothetical protein